MGNTCTSTCSHLEFIDGKCISCGAIDGGTTPTIAVNYYKNGLRLSQEAMNHMRDKYTNDLLAMRKLHLVLDIYHTLLHCIRHTELAPEDAQLLNDPSFLAEDMLRTEKLLVKFRPYVRTFLSEASKLFKLTLYTSAGRKYGQSMATYLDPKGEYFKEGQIICKEDCTKENKKGLDVVMTHERVTLVVDDNRAVWEGYEDNLINVPAYIFFRHPKLMNDLSCTQRGQDENGRRYLWTALHLLKWIHSLFFDGCPERDLASRDVRGIKLQVMSEIRKNSARRRGSDQMEYEPY